MNASQLIISAAVTGFAGIVQGMSGFGFGTIMMVFLPLLFPVIQASAICQCLGAIGNIVMIYPYRNNIKWKTCLSLWAIYFPVFFCSIKLTNYISTQLLKPILGGVLVLTAIYCLMFAEKISLKKTVWTTVLCASISAVMDALFGFGGPPVVLYILNVTQDRDDYLGTIYALFMGTSVGGTVVRLIMGQLSIEMMPYIVLISLGLFAGLFFGWKLVKKVNQVQLKKIVYSLIGFAGAVSLVTNL